LTKVLIEIFVKSIISSSIHCCRYIIWIYYCRGR